MYGRYAHVPRLELVDAVARLPWLEYRDTPYSEWAHSGFGRYVPEQLDEQALEAEAVAKTRVA